MALEPQDTLATILASQKTVAISKGSEAMTHEETGVLAILYIFGVVIVIQEARLRLARKRTGYLEDLTKRSAATAELTPPINPKLAPKAVDATLPMSNPLTTPTPIKRTASAIVRQFYSRLKCLSINKE
jgi:hypothetical protein